MAYKKCFQIPSEEEKKDEKVLLGSLYSDKEFLRQVFQKCQDHEELKEVSEEGFTFLTER